MRIIDDLFSSNNPFDGSCLGVIDAVVQIIAPEINDELMWPYTKEEVFVDLSQMHPCKAPDPNSMHAIFCKMFWHIIGEDVSKYVCRILNGSRSLSQVNGTNVDSKSKVVYPYD